MSRDKLNVPVMSSNVTEGTREQHLLELKRAKADRVFIALDRCLAAEGDPERLALMSGLKENIAYFEKQGLDVGVWTPTAVGHPLAPVWPRNSTLLACRYRTPETPYAGPHQLKKMHGCVHHTNDPGPNYISVTTVGP